MITPYGRGEIIEWRPNGCLVLLDQPLRVYDPRLGRDVATNERKLFLTGEEYAKILGSRILDQFGDL